jgi:hypothetical protein
VKDIQRNQYGPMNMDMATMASEAHALQFVGWGVNSRKHVRFYLWKSEAHHPCSENDSHPLLRGREILRITWVPLAHAQQMLKPWQASLLAKILPAATH